MNKKIESNLSSNNDINNNTNNNTDSNSLSFADKVKLFDPKFKTKIPNEDFIYKKSDNKKISKNTDINLNIKPKINENRNKNLNSISPEEKKDENKIDDFEVHEDINQKKEKNLIDDFEVCDIAYDFDLKDANIDDFNIEPISKSDIILDEIEINLWGLIPISFQMKKAKKDYMKSLMSSVVYNGVKFKDKLSEDSNKSIIIYDSLIDDFNIKKIKNYFVYMSYRNGLYNTKFFPGSKNNYTSDCGWGCMVRCCQMMLSRAFIKFRLHDLININEDKNIELKSVKREVIYYFYDKFISIQEIHINKSIFEVYKNILKNKANVIEIIPPYSIYILTLLGNCPNIHTSDHNMIKTMMKINKTLFNENIAMVHFIISVNKKKIFENFCEKIEPNFIDKNENDFLIYNSEKYLFKKRGIVFISLRLGLQKIDSSYIEMIPKLFNNLHNNIGFVSGKKKSAYYFIGITDNKLIFADPHFNQNQEKDEKNFPSYSVNELFLMPVKEICSEITLGVTICCKKDIEQLFDDLSWFKEINPEFIGFDEG